MESTPLTHVHEALGARMTEFAGTRMPLQYRGIAEEHLAVRERCGIFDVSHMAEFRIDGEGAREFLRYALLNDAGKLRVGRAHYSMMPNDEGGLIDDVYVYHLAEESWLVVANASNRGPVRERLHALVSGRDGVEVSDVSDEWALLAVQGPGAALLLDRLVDTDLTGMRKNDTRPALLAGRPVRLARTGYTGEDGFEVFARPQDAADVWTAVTDAGAVPCGLGARDTLRLEAGFPLYGHELTATTDPRCTPFAWVVKDKPFAGRDGWPAPACSRRLIGLRVVGRGIARQGYRILNGVGEEAGEVTSGTLSPLTRDSIAFAWIDAGLAEPGREVDVEIRGQRVSATVTEPPFFRA